MKKITPLFVISLFLMCFGPLMAQSTLISEFEPNPTGADPANVNFELSGTPGTSFSGWILSFENDGASGLVDRATSVSGTFDSNGLLVVSIPDLENPSFTVALVSNFTGVAGTTDIDSDDDGTADDLSSLGTVLDAIGVPDAVADEATLYGTDLGGTDLAFSGDEPRLIFRDASVGPLYVINDPDNGQVFDASGTDVTPAIFNTDPTVGTDTFGVINPSTDGGGGDDMVPPTAVCRNITVSLDSEGNATITAADVDGGSSDNVGIASLTIDTDTFTIADLGENEVTLTVTDTSGNMATCVAIVTVEEMSSVIVTLRITEIMYNPSSAEDNWEWVEIYNAGEEPVDLSGYVIDDGNGVAHPSANIASGILPPGTSAILYNSDDVSASDFRAAWGNVNLIPVTNWGAMALNNGGDTIGIWNNFSSYSGDHATQLNVIEQVAYDDDGTIWPSDNGQSSIYLSDLSADNTVGTNWALSADGATTPIFDAYTATAVGGNSGNDIGSPGLPLEGLVITEVMYNPSSAEDNWEWVEIYNIGSSEIDLTGYVIDDNNGTAHPSANIAGGTLAPGASAILYNADDVGAADFGSAWGNVNLIAVSNWSAMGLNNGGDTIGIWENFEDYTGDNQTQNNVVEQLAYDDDGTVWPADDGFASIYLTDLFSDNTDGSNWALSTDGATTPLFDAYTAQNAGGNSGNDIGSPGVLIIGEPVFISQVQGTGTTVAITEPVIIEAIVVGDFQNDSQLDGFYVQEEDVDADGDPNTSEGIFVFCGSNNCGAFPDVAVGDKVQVTGTPTDFGAQSQIAMSSLSVISSGNDLPTAATIDLPVNAVADLEAYEGMRVTFVDKLYVTEHFNLGSFGEVVLTSQNDRLPQPTAIAAPGTDANAVAAANFLDRIVLDDGQTGSGPEPLVFPLGFDALNTLRGGDSLEPGLTGVLGEGFNQYRIQPTGTVNFSSTNPRTEVPEDVGGNIKVASFNVLNFFTTLNERGAESAFEFNRQRDKILAAIRAIDADITGLIELENNATASLQSLIDGLNAVDGADAWAFVDAGVIGTDQIKVGIIYKTAVVQESGAPAILDSSVDARFIDTQNRPVLAQTFEVVDSDNPDFGEGLTVAVTHLKSKGSDCDALGDPDIGDGQGNCNQTRTSAAFALVDWLATNPTGNPDTDVIVLGDFNAYQMEDPITAMKLGPDDTADTEDDYTQLVGPEDYSFVFSGLWGSLDNAFVNGSLQSQVTGTTSWHISADEPRILDYNDNFQSPAQIAAWYNVDPYRASDHDPIIVGMDLSGDVELTVTAFYLINADTNEDIGLITEGGLFDIGALPTTNLSIRAEATNDTESVRLELTGALGTARTENIVPYALFGDKSGNYSGQEFGVGTYMLKATPYSGKGLSGDIGTARTVNFELTNENLSILSFALVDADTDQDIMTLTDGAEVDLSVLPTSNLNIRALATLGTGSVQLELGGAMSAMRTENVAPFALYGDSSGDFGGQAFIPGDYSLEATPYSESGLGGTQGTSLALNFVVLDQNQISTSALALYPNPANVEVMISIDEKAGIQEFLIYDIYGMLVANYPAESFKRAADYALNVSTLKAGIYFLVAVNGQGPNLEKRLVIAR
ncbi:ExeM/NucH family extracellular endonuclease [Flavobacteriaceae bacterium 3-367]